MTTEERSRQTWGAVNDPFKSGEEREAIILKALRDQIEDCARVADKTAKDFTDWDWPDKQRYAPTMAETAESIASNIRALAEPTENKAEGKGD